MSIALAPRCRGLSLYWCSCRDLIPNYITSKNATMWLPHLFVSFAFVLWILSNGVPRHSTPSVHRLIQTERFPDGLHCSTAALQRLKRSAACVFGMRWAGSHLTARCSRSPPAAVNQTRVKCTALRNTPVAIYYEERKWPIWREKRSWLLRWRFSQAEI